MVLSNRSNWGNVFGGLCIFGHRRRLILIDLRGVVLMNGLGLGRYVRRFVRSRGFERSRSLIRGRGFVARRFGRSGICRCRFCGLRSFVNFRVCGGLNSGPKLDGQSCDRDERFECFAVDAGALDAVIDVKHRDRTSANYERNGIHPVRPAKAERFKELIVVGIGTVRAFGGCQRFGSTAKQAC